MSWKNYNLWIAILLVLLVISSGVLAWYVFGQPKQETIEVERQSVTETVEFKGHVEAQTIARLGFERSGIVKEVNVSVGDVVRVGDQLARLDTRATELDVAEAFARRVSERDKAQIAVGETNAALSNIKLENTQLLEQKRQVVRNVKAEFDQVRKVRQQSVSINGDESVAAKVAYADVLAAETAYNAAQKDLTKTQETISKTNQAASDAYSKAQESYDSVLRASGSVAGLSVLEASEKRARAQLSKDTLVSSIAGTVTDVVVEPGEVAVAGEVLITLQTTDQKEIIADVDEIDIGRVKAGMLAEVEFDAYPGEKWDAKVVKIDPAGVIENEDDVVYKVTLQLDREEDKLLPALTARVKIKSGERANVVSIPQLAAESIEGEHYVYVMKGQGFEKRKVEFGIVGTDGLAEIVSGLMEGEIVLRRPSIVN